MREFGRGLPFLIFLSALIAGISFSPSAMAAPGQKNNKPHSDCNFCHLKHSESGVSPLWSPNISQGNFQSGKHADLRQQINSSKVCLSCHDGTIGSDQAINLGAEAKDTVSADLGRSHPVSMDYSASFSRKRRNLRHPSTLGDIRLFDGKVECGTCHDIHASFRLRTSKRALCTSCHNM